MPHRRPCRSPGRVPPRPVPSVLGVSTGPPRTHPRPRSPVPGLASAPPAQLRNPTGNHRGSRPRSPLTTGPGPAGGRGEIEAWAAVPRPELGTGPGARRRRRLRHRDRTGERGEPTGGRGSPFLRCRSRRGPAGPPPPPLTSAPRPPCAAPPPAAVNGFQTGLGRPNQPISARRTASPRADWAIRRQAPGGPGCAGPPSGG